jgi:hypothetical protein
MRVKLVWVERDFRGRELSRREGYVRANKMGSNCWKYVYAEPLEDARATQEKAANSPG